MKKTLILLMLVVTLLLPVTIADSTVWNIDYETTIIRTIPGDVTLEGVVGTLPEGMSWSDLTLTRSFDGVITTYTIKSNTIDPSPPFTANTKGYFYRNENITSEYYEIRVDYSAFIPPPWWALQDQINNLTSQVADLQSQVANLTANNTDLLQQVNELNSTVHNLTENVTYWKTNSSEWWNAYNTTKADYDTLQAQYDQLEDQSSVIATLQGEKSSLTSQLNTVRNNYHDLWNEFNDTAYEKSILQWENEEQNRTIDALVDPISITYPRDGLNSLKVNIPWFLIGVLGLFFVEYAFERRKGTSTIKGQKRTAIDPLRRFLPFLPQKEKPKVEVWNDDGSVSDLEKSILKTKEIKKEESPNIDNVVIERTPKEMPLPDKSKEEPKKEEPKKSEVVIEPSPKKIEPETSEVHFDDSKEYGEQEDGESPSEKDKDAIIKELTEKLDRKEKGKPSQKRSTVWWNSPEGLKRKEELRNRARDWNRKRHG